MENNTTDTVSKEDVLQLQVIELQNQVLNLQTEVLQLKQQLLNIASSTINNSLKDRYQLQEGDIIDPATLKVVRKS